jgi:hypothetical protein
MRCCERAEFVQPLFEEHHPDVLHTLSDCRGRVPLRLGAIGHGPDAAALTAYLCDEIRNWGPARGQRTPTLIVYPAGTPDAELAGPAFDKTHSRFVLTYDQQHA